MICRGRLALLLLLLGAMPSAGGIAAAAEGDSTGVIRFQRILAPQDRIKDWPLGGVKYLPVGAA